MSNTCGESTTREYPLFDSTPTTPKTPATPQGAWFSRSPFPSVSAYLPPSPAHNAAPPSSKAARITPQPRWVVIRFIYLRIVDCVSSLRVGVNDRSCLYSLYILEESGLPAVLCCNPHNPRSVCTLCVLTPRTSKTNYTHLNNNNKIIKKISLVS